MENKNINKEGYANSYTVYSTNYGLMLSDKMVTTKKEWMKL